MKRLLLVFLLLLLGCGGNPSSTPVIPFVQHEVSLSWNSSLSNGVIGYNVYRGNISGGPYTRLNSSVELGLLYEDFSVQSKLVYFYVVTAVGDNSEESLFSEEIKAEIP